MEKTCTKCGETKPLSEFFRTTNTLSGRSNQCKPCEKPHLSFSRARHRARLEEEIRAGFKTCTKCKETKSLDCFSRSPANQDLYKSLCKACANALTREWQRKNPARVLAAAKRAFHKRRAMLQNTICDLTAEQWEEIKAAYDFKCAYCGERPKGLTQDHVIPVTRGGAHTALNIVPACRPCNARKYNHLNWQISQISPEITEIDKSA